MDFLRKIFEGLNDRQAEAVQAPLGPVLVLAGAGSGKTKVLAHRVANLIATGKFMPENILALTFTNKAAKEMQQRIQKMLSLPPVENSRRLAAPGIPTVGTFHSVCARILRNEISKLGYTSSFVIYDADDQIKIIREICQNRNLGSKFPPNLFRNYISSAKNVLQTPEDFELPLDPFLFNITRDIYIEYQNTLFRQNALDFDDLLMLTVKIFRINQEVLKFYQQLFRYILVDEYQDTNPAQYAFLYLLAVGTQQSVGHRNLFVVGDDAQSIYGFRGSDLRNILNFEEHFPDCIVVKLEQNYRSTKNILGVAQEVIELNAEQKQKKLWTQNEPGHKVCVLEVEDEIEEAKFVAKTIIADSTRRKNTGELEYERNGSSDESAGGSEEDEPAGQPQEEPKKFSILDSFLKKYRTTAPAAGFNIYGLPQLPKNHQTLNKYAVLYRTHAQSRAIEEVFLQSKIPYQIVGGLKFYQRKEIKDVLAYLRLVLNYRDLVSMRRIINEPARGIGERSYQVIKDTILKLKEDASLGQLRLMLSEINLSARQFNSTQEFFRLIEEFSLFAAEENILSLMRLVLKKTGYENWVRDGTEEGENRWANIEELFNVASKYQNLPWQEALEEFLEEVALMTEIDEMSEAKDAVTLMSLHQAKGLEFESVFFVGLEEGILPHSRSLLSPPELSEEIRLAYVGMTRARKKLYLIYAQRRRMFGAVQSFPPSRILKAVPFDKTKFQTLDGLDF